MALARTPPKGSRPEDLTIEDYDEAWDLFQAGLRDKSVGEVLALSTPQVRYLYSKGLVVGDVKLPSFRERVARELAETAKVASKTGKRIAGLASRVLIRATENADDATVLVSMIFRAKAARMAAELQKPVAEQNVEQMQFTENELATLRTLRLYQDISKSALAYQLVFGHHAGANRALMAAERLVSQLRDGKTSGDESGSLPAALALMDEVGGEGAAIQLKDEIIATMGTWSMDDLLRYADTGEEPGGSAQPGDSEPIDVEYEERGDGSG